VGGLALNAIMDALAAHSTMSRQALDSDMGLILASPWLKSTERAFLPLNVLRY